MTPEEIKKMLEQIQKLPSDKIAEIKKALMVEGEDKIGKEKSPKAQAAMKAVGRILGPMKDELKKSDMDEMMKSLGMADEEDCKKVDIEMSATQSGEKVKDEHVALAKASAKKAFDDELQKLGYQMYPEQQITQKKKSDEDEEDEDEGEDDVSKVNKADEKLSAFNAEQKVQLESIFKANEELVTKNADLEKQLKAEREIRVNREFDEKAAKYAPIGDVKKFATILKSASEQSAESLKTLEDMLDGQLAASKASEVFKEYGTRRSAEGGDYETKIEALVDSKFNEIRKSDKSMTREMVYEEVLKSDEGKKLYTAFKNSRKGGA